MKVEYIDFRGKRDIMHFDDNIPAWMVDGCMCALGPAWSADGELWHGLRKEGAEKIRRSIGRDRTLAVSVSKSPGIIEILVPVLACSLEDIALAVEFHDHEIAAFRSPFSGLWHYTQEVLHGQYRPVYALCGMVGGRWRR